MLNYSVTIHDAKTHTFDVTLTIPSPGDKLRVSLPVWIPGSYLIREFSKHLSKLVATQTKCVLSITQIDKCTWEIDSKVNDGALELSWQVYAFDTSVRAAYLDQFRGFINGTSVFLRPHGFEKTPIQLKLENKDKTLKNWSYACALAKLKTTKVKRNTIAVLKAKDYDELVDSPIELGQFWHGQFKVAGILHEFVVANAPDSFDGNRLIRDTQRICEQVIQFWHGKNGKPPYKRYVFMLNAMHDGYGGLEHCNSTALICKRSDLPFVGDPVDVTQVRTGYQNLLTLICHEFFHTWHVKRLRPEELAVYDYTRENYTQLLWFFEGVTSYYEYMLVYRAGLLTQEQLLDWMAKDFNAVQRMPGRKVQSVAQASFDAWVKFYRIDENTANATISYYTKGAMIALCLDLMLRSQGKSSLDSVLRQLWENSDGGPISKDDILTALMQVGKRSYVRELNAWVDGIVELPVEKLLKKAGVLLQSQPVTTAQKLGLNVATTNGQLIIKNVHHLSAAQQAGLAASDELIAVNGWRITELSQWATYAQGMNPIAVTFARDARMHVANLELQQDAWNEVCFKMQPIHLRKDLNTSLKTWPKS